MADPKSSTFHTLKALFSPYVPPLTVTKETATVFELVSQKPGIINGRTLKETYFGAVAVRSNYVGLYLIHVYLAPKKLEKVPPALRKCLKGRSCFHIKKLDNQLVNDIRDTLADAFRFYQQHELV